MPAISLTAIFAAFSLSLPPILVMVPKAAVLLLVAAALATAYAAWRRDARLPLPSRALSACLLLFFAWALVSCIWTFEPGESLFLLARLGALLAAGYALLFGLLLLEDLALLMGRWSSWLCSPY